MQLQYTFLGYSNVWRTVQDDTFERSYTKVPFIFIALTAGSLLIYPYVYKYMISIGQLYVVSLTAYRADRNHIRILM